MAPYRRNDPDSEHFWGCLSFGLWSVLFFTLGAWPFFVWQGTHVLGVMVTALSLALVPMFVAGALAVRLGGISGTGSFLAGSLTFGIFFYLRHIQFGIVQNVPDQPQLEYPSSYAWLIPAAVLIAVVLWTVIWFPKAPPGNSVPRQ